MNDHNLDDLIIGEPPMHTKKRSKGILTIIALIVIILLIGILLARMILTSPEDDIVLSDANQTEFVSPELIPAEKSGELDTANELTPMKKEEIPTPKKREEPKKEIKKPEKKPEKVVKKEEPKPKKVEKKVVKPKKVEKKPVKKVTKPSKLFRKDGVKYYVQIGAFNKDPNKKFLAKIKDAGFSYIINRNENTRRVRVGPYPSYDDAKEGLAKVADMLNIKGFVIKSKPE